MTYAYKQVIDAPIARVWSFLDDDEKLPLWMPQSVEITYPDGINRQALVGTRFRQKLKEGGRIREYQGEVTAHEPPYLLGIRLFDDSFAVDVIYRLTSDGDKTTLDYRADVALKSLMARIMGRLFGWLTKRLIRQLMGNLKRVAEARDVI
ncbi:MAG: SRPBCC family protein [Methyloligellaceae bacterium]